MLISTFLTMLQAVTKIINYPVDHWLLKPNTEYQLRSNKYCLLGFIGPKKLRIHQNQKSMTKDLGALIAKEQ